MAAVLSCFMSAHIQRALILVVIPQICKSPPALRSALVSWLLEASGLQESRSTETQASPEASKASRKLCRQPAAQTSSACLARNAATSANPGHVIQRPGTWKFT